jgi:hypothetical protein
MPPEFEGVTVYTVSACAAVGVPVNAPVAVLNDTPAGYVVGVVSKEVGELVHAFAMSSLDTAEPTSYVTVVGSEYEHMPTGCCGMTAIISGKDVPTTVTGGDTEESTAEGVTWYTVVGVLATVGVPVTTKDEEKVRPAGSAGVIVKALGLFMHPMGSTPTTGEPEVYITLEGT